MYRWITSFFWTPPALERVDICTATFQKEIDQLANFFQSPENQHKIFYFHYFDFSQHDFFEKMLFYFSDRTIFYNAVIPVDQLIFLLEKEIDVSKWQYIVLETISFEKYCDLIDIAQNENLGNTKIKINLTNIDLKNHPDHIFQYAEIQECIGVKIRQEQLFFYLSHSENVVDLSKFILEKIDLGFCIQKYSEKIIISSKIYADEIIFDISSLAFCALEKKWHDIFKNPSFYFTLKIHEDAMIPAISLQEILDRIHLEKPPKTPRLLESQTLPLFDLMQKTLDKDINFSVFSFSTLSPYHKCLLVFYSAQHYPKTPLSKRIYGLIGFNEQFNQLRRLETSLAQPF